MLFFPSPPPKKTRRTALLDFADMPLMLFFVLNSSRFVMDADFIRVRGAFFTLGGILMVFLSSAVSCSYFNDNRHYLSRSSSRSQHCSGYFGAIIGVSLLFFCSLLLFGRFKRSQALAAEIGGLRHLNCLALLVAPLWLLPLFLWNVFYGASDRRHPVFSFSIIWQCCVSGVLILMLNLYMEPFLLSKATQIPSLKEYRLLGATLLASALSMVHGDGQVTLLSVLAFCLLFLGLRMRASRSLSFSTDLPFYSARGSPQISQFLSKVLSQIAVQLRQIMRQTLGNQDSRKIFFFAMLNVSFMFIEAIVGLLTNSLGLLGDAGHMFFDNAALFIGLWACYMTSLENNPAFSYGYERFGVLAGFVNSIFLLFLAITLLIEAFERFYEPPQVLSDNLLLTSVGGFIINASGLFIFHDIAHSHGQEEGCAHDLLGPIALKQGLHGHHGHDCKEQSLISIFNLTNNVNMQGILLHLLVDTVGSVSVIISSALIHLYGLHIADPICTVLVAILIIYSSVPLILKSANLLLQRTPPALEQAISLCLEDISKISDVLSIRESHFWDVPTRIVGTVHVEVRDEAEYTKVQATIRNVVYGYLNQSKLDLTVQIERPGWNSVHQSLSKSITSSGGSGITTSLSSCSSASPDELRHFHAG